MAAINGAVPWCEQWHPEPAEHHQRADAEILALYDTWSDVEAKRLLPEAEDLDRLEARFAWFQQSLGRCPSTPTLSMLNSQQLRSIRTCQHGRLELEFIATGDPKPTVSRFRSFARGVLAPQQLHRAALRVLAIYHDPDLVRATELFGDRKRAERYLSAMARIQEKLGTCELRGVDRSTDRESDFWLGCRNGNAILQLKMATEQGVKSINVIARTGEISSDAFLLDGVDPPTSTGPSTAGPNRR